MPDPSEEERVVRIVATSRRKRTVSASLRDGVLEVRVPHWMDKKEREIWADRLRLKVERQLQRRRPGDAELEERARSLNRRLFGGRLSWTSISFARQARRWGSCTSASGLIRLSTRAKTLPTWVLDYLLVHEMAHLEVPDHSPDFWALVGAYPLTERARGYLMALDHRRQSGPEGEGEEEETL